MPPGPSPKPAESKCAIALRVQPQSGSASIGFTGRPSISRGCARTHWQRSKTGSQSKAPACFKPSRRPDRTARTYVGSRPWKRLASTAKGPGSCAMTDDSTRPSPSRDDSRKTLSGGLHVLRNPTISSTDIVLMSSSVLGLVGPTHPPSGYTDST